MKKIVLPLLILLLLALPGCTKAAPVLTEAEFADPYVPLTIRQADGTVVDTALSAYVRRHEVLVPLAAVTEYLKRDYLVAADGAGLTVTVTAPKFALETPRLTELIKDGVDFRLNAGGSQPGKVVQEINGKDEPVAGATVQLQGKLADAQGKVAELTVQMEEEALQLIEILNRNAGH